MGNYRHLALLPSVDVPTRRVSVQSQVCIGLHVYERTGFIVAVGAEAELDQEITRVLLLD